MSDDQHLLSLVSFRDLPHRLQGPGGHLRQGFARRRALEIDPVSVEVDEAGEHADHLGGGHAAPAADVDLPQPGIRHHVESVGFRDHVGGAEGPFQVGCVAGLEIPVREEPGRLLGLPLPHLVEFDIRLSLQFSELVPFRATVPQEHKFCVRHCSSSSCGTGTSCTLSGICGQSFHNRSRL